MQEIQENYENFRKSNEHNFTSLTAFVRENINKVCQKSSYKKKIN